jgi:hypothetical protein
MSNLFKAGLVVFCGFAGVAPSQAQNSNVAIDVLPAMLAAAATEAKAKGESPLESMKALVGVVYIIKRNPEEGKHLLEDKFQIAQTFEVADFASRKCLGLHFIDDALMATEADLGFTEEDDTIYSPEYNFWADRGQMNAKIGYDKDPAGWCESMWHFLGPTHPPMIKRALLSKDQPKQ